MPEMCHSKNRQNDSAEDDDKIHQHITDKVIGHSEFPPAPVLSRHTDIGKKTLKLFVNLFFFH
jgi:hypothetical protein